jgi:large subunit ribosomal protein L5
MARLKEDYNQRVVPALVSDLGLKNVMQVPRVQKVVLNIGMGEALTNSNSIEAATRDLATITGQKPVVTRAKKSVANFRLREGVPIGVKVTLRGEKMWNFLDRLMNVALPRQRDFRGISPDAFDGRGNYTLGLSEQLSFPEIDYDKIDRIRGMEITIVTSAKNDEEGRRLLTLLGMPFKQRGSGR